MIADLVRHEYRHTFQRARIRARLRGRVGYPLVFGAHPDRVSDIGLDLSICSDTGSNLVPARIVSRTFCTGLVV